jgi:hypothetical protein
LSRLAEDQPGTVSGYIPSVPGGRPAPAGACWADPLSANDRRVLARKLARACKSFYAATQVPGRGRASVSALLVASAEMSILHTDVTERAAVATERAAVATS